VRRALGKADPSARQENRAPRHAIRFVRTSRLDPAMPAAQQIVLLLGLVAPELFFFSLSGEGSREGERLCCATLRFLRVTLRLFPLREPQSQADEPRCELISPRSEALRSLLGSNQPHVALTVSRCRPVSPRSGASPPRSDVHEPRGDPPQPRCDASTPRSGSSQPQSGSSQSRCSSSELRCGSSQPQGGSPQPQCGSSEPRSGSSEPQSDAKKPQRDAFLPRRAPAQLQDGPARRRRRVVRQQRQEPAPPCDAISSSPRVSLPQSLARLP
jgi:hypothetical protein